MDAEILVHIDLNGATHLVGRLWAHSRRNRESATFEYDKSWLARTDRFSLDPALAVGPGPFHTSVGKALFGAIGDSAPDRWGRALMRRSERRRAERAGESPRALREIDCLLSVDDESRAGALRFALKVGGPFLAERGPTKIPPLVELPRLLSAAEKVLDNSDRDDDLRLLLAPGSSLGGARPKASIRDRDGHLCIAKFPHHADEVNIVLWEAVALTLAARAGLTVPKWRVESAAKRPVLLLRRFDRAKCGTRIPFLSAMSMLGARDNETRSYMEFADALRQHGAAPRDDIRSVWRRIVFNVLISNTDDHLRNHGFLYGGSAGWRLAPAYDLNPVPADIKPRVLNTAINLDDTTASLARAIEVAAYFEIKPVEARRIAATVGRAVSNWRKFARRLGIAARESDRMSSAFEHDDLKAAISGK